MESNNITLQVQQLCEMIHLWMTIYMFMTSRMIFITFLLLPSAVSVFQITLFMM